MLPIEPHEGPISAFTSALFVHLEVEETPESEWRVSAERRWPVGYHHPRPRKIRIFFEWTVRNKQLFRYASAYLCPPTVGHNM